MAIFERNKKIKKTMSDIRIGQGYDVHKLAEGETLTLCGIKIDYHKGTVAHSDGDVAIHALCDAILGALALGDIGQHFPDTSDKFKNIDSTILLTEVMKMINTRGYILGNADITLVLEEPKMRPHIMAMRARLAPLLATDTSRISIKATTTEHLGFTGRGEGIAAYATVLLFQKTTER